MRSCQITGSFYAICREKRTFAGYTYEPWHLRHVGCDAARKIAEQGITFEEYPSEV